MKNTEPENRRRPRRAAAVTGMLGLCVVLGVVLAVQLTSQKLTRDLRQLTPFVSAAPTLTTAAGNEVNDVPDPHHTTTQTQPTEPPVSAPEATATQPTTTQTTVPPTQPAAEPIVNEAFVLPVDGTGIGKDYSPDAPVFSATMGDWRTHGGIDFSAPADSDVRAVGNGVVTKVVSDVRWGYVIEIDHGSFVARYCSVAQENAVEIGAAVQAGDVIGRLSAPPVESEDAPHLHFETRRDGVLLDPLEALEMR